MNFLNEFLSHLLGSNTPAWWSAALVWVIFGMLLSLYLSVRQRDKTSPETPYEFKLSFFLKDNLVRVVTGLLISVTILRFSHEYIGTEATLWLAFLYGLGSDKLTDLLEKIRDSARK